MRHQIISLKLESIEVSSVTVVTIILAWDMRRVEMFHHPSNILDSSFEFVILVALTEAYGEGREGFH